MSQLVQVLTKKFIKQFIAVKHMHMSSDIPTFF